MITQNQISIATQGRGIVPITSDIAQCVQQSQIQKGLCHIICLHTSASLFINENADPDVQHDLEAFLSGLVQDGDPRFRHTLEGDDDMAGHIRTLLTQTELTVPVVDGQLMLGTWQGIYLWEHRYQHHHRRCFITIMGE